MVPSFNELIDHLLNEISLCGDFGASPFDVCRFIKEFYDEASNRLPTDEVQASDDNTTQDAESSRSPLSSVRQLVDRSLEEVVWTWLTGNPEVSVGRHREGNRLTLGEAEATHKGQGDANARSSFLRQSSRQPSTAETRNDEKPSSTATGGANEASDHTEGLQVFVSTSRMWLAVAGHERDDARLPPLEFALLSIIAMHKGKGIAQPELTRLSGQDKRSVPKRTDKLAQRGYIEKKAVHFKSARTSLCTLQRFAGRAEADPDEQDHSLYDFKAILNKLFSILKESQVITRDDLKEAMGMTDRKPRKILMRALKKLERIGCLERVKAVSQYSDILRSKQLSIRFIREPTQEDLRLFYEDSRALVEFLNRGEDEGEGDKEGEEETAGITPQWTPDRPFYNQMYSLIEESGTQGMTNLEIVKSSVGMFYRRPIEATMNRLVEAWPSAQPLHLRKFGIVRDSALHGTISHYVHYTFENFKKLLDEGNVSRDALDQVFPAANQRKKESRIAPLDAVAELDEYGFPRGERPTGLLRNGNASLRECLEVVKPVPTPITKWQPQIVRRPDGTREVVLDHTHRATMKGRRDFVRHEDPNRISVTEKLGNDATGGGSSTAEKRKVSGVDDEEGVAQPSARKKAKRLDVNEEMTEKEKLEALGMGMTWTEYAVLMIPRPTAGAYLTPFGKRRPTGHARGRPKKSRILIVKSEKLREFDWFTEEATRPTLSPQGVDGVTPPDESSQPQKDETGLNSHGNRRLLTRKRKRSQNGESSEDTGETVVTSDERAQSRDVEQVVSSQSKHDKRQPGKGSQEPIETVNPSMPNSSELSTAPAEATVDGNTVASHRPLEKLLDESNDGLHHETHQESAQGQRNLPMAEPSQATVTSPLGAAAELPRAAQEPRADEGLPTAVKIKSEHEPETKLNLRRRERGAGTVNMLRRKVLMQILEACHGMFPFGSELWYPFTTAWMKLMKQSAKPDMRTIKMAVKNLVESGKVRQLNFSGRNSKGVLVTRSIITNTDIQGDDARVIAMQKEILSADPGLYIPPEAEVDPALRKSHKAALPPMARFREHDEEVTVVMRHAPLRVRHAVARMRLRTGNDEARLRALQQGITRLASTHAQPRNAIAVPPQWEEDFNRRRNMARWKSKLSEHGIEIPGRRGQALEKPENAPSLPKKLQDILSIMDPITPAYDTGLDSNTHRFFVEIDAVQQWEVEVFELYREYVTPEPGVWEFINHTAHGPQNMVTIEEPIQWAESEIAPVPTIRKLPEPATRPSKPVSEQPTARPRQVRRRRRKGTVQKERRLTSLHTQAAAAAAAEKKVGSKTTAGRRSRVLRSLSTDIQRRIITALVVLRTLAGGNEGKVIDWSLIQFAFPNADAAVITRRGKSLLAKHRLQISKLQNEFQEMFLEAYETGQVPPIDYERIEEYDWAWLVDWASEELEFSSDNPLPSLPSTRTRFDNVFDVRAEPPQQLDEIYQQSTVTTNARRQHLYSSIPFSTSLQPDGVEGKSPEAERLEAAKTWVRANVVASDETFDANAAEAMLAHLGPDLVADAKQSLVQEAVIHQRNKGRFVPGRSYDLTDHFILTLGRRRQIDSVQLQRAAHFKQSVLDLEFRLSGKFLLKYDAEDGDILALINMVQSGRVSIHALNPPRDKYGLTDGGYLTRMMDKGKLRFDVELRPVDGCYIYGNPIEATPTIPRGELPHDFPASAAERAPCKIPLWFDIHGNLVHVLWHSAAAAVIGLLAARPGSKSEDIERMLHPCLAVWEINLIFDYMVEAGIVERVEKASYVKEWWWMALSLELKQ